MQLDDTFNKKENETRAVIRTNSAVIHKEGKLSWPFSSHGFLSSISTSCLETNWRYSLVDIFIILRA